MSLRKQAAGKMKARAVAETPPVISSMTPRSQVIRETVIQVIGYGAVLVWMRRYGVGMEGDVRSMEAKRMEVVKKRWRCMLNTSCEKKYCSMT